MTPQPSHVTVLAQDPVENLARRLGTATVDARRKLDSLIVTLRELDNTLTVLKDDHGLDANVDLGPIGNAAAAARRDLEKDRGQTFTLPR